MRVGGAHASRRGGSLGHSSFDLAETLMSKETKRNEPEMSLLRLVEQDLDILSMSLDIV